MSDSRPTRPRLFSEGRKLLQRKNDDESEQLAELASSELASLLASAPVMERALQESLKLISMVWGSPPSAYEEIDKLQKLETKLKHALRVAAGDLSECQCEDCRFSAAPGAQYCEYHLRDLGHYYPEDFPCAVRGCEQPTGLGPPEPLLCREHNRENALLNGRALGRKNIYLEEWLSRLADGSLSAWRVTKQDEGNDSSSIPGLGDEVTRSGLPVGIDPEPIEAALLLAGRERCTAGGCVNECILGRIWCQEHAQELDASH
jgi:hypothetical protein